MLEILTDYWASLLQQPFDPRKRIYLGYLVSAAVIAILWGRQQGASSKNAFFSLYKTQIWFSRSAKADYAIILINHAVMLFLSPILLARLTVASAVYYALAQMTSAPGLFSSVSPTVASASFTLCLFILDDWSRFALHRWMHKSAFLWSFHKVHHSARSLTPLTVYRVHPVEGVLFSLRSTLVQGSCTAVFVFFMGNSLSLLSILGSSVFLFIFNALGSNLRHSHIRISYWPAIERFFISPFQHQLHHSTAPRHFNKNYGAVLAIWDFMNGSLDYSRHQSTPRFGLGRRETKQEHTLKNVYWRPITEAFLVLKKRIIKRTHL